MSLAPLASLKNFLYDKGILEVRGPSIPVVSIGNLTMGGTGKTPTLLHLLSYFKDSKIKVGVVSRGYGGSYQGVQSLHIKPGGLVQAAETFGDEPTLIKYKFPEVPVVVCRDRIRACEELQKKNEQVRLIFADDAFQHRRLKRNVDIVILDALAADSSYGVFPFGRAREGFRGLDRAQFVVMNRVNLVDPKKVAELEARVKKVSSAQILKASVRLLVPELEGLLANPKKPLLVCGIGRPESFVAALKDLSIQPQESLFFPDHHHYSKKDVGQILKKREQVGAGDILVTEKDYVKLEGFSELSPHLKVAQLVEDFSPEVEKLYEVLLRLAR